MGSIDKTSMQRRRFIQAASVASIGALVSPSLFLTSCMRDSIVDPAIESNTPFNNPLPSLPSVGTSATLVAQNSLARIFPNVQTRVLGYRNDGILGPTFRARRNDPITVRLQNGLNEATNIHWHGLLVPANMDGHPKDLAQAGGSFAYQYTISQRAGTYWYHPHPHRRTAKQVFMGLAGFFIVSDSEEEALRLPSGDYEILLVIQDKRTNSSRTDLTYNPNMMDVMTGFLGDKILTNGRHGCFVNVATRYYRFRILNGSTARIYNLALSNNAQFYVIGNDGGLLPTLQMVHELLLGPGERADLLIDFSPYNVGTEMYLVSKTFANGGMAQGRQRFEILRFKVDRQEHDTFNVPTALSNIQPLSPGSAVQTRRFDISNPGMMMGGHRINNKTFDPNRIDETVRFNTTEVWEFDNTNGDDPHPMHIHGVQFQVVRRVGGRNTVMPWEMGWKDTVLVMPGEKVQVIMRFEAHKGTFVFHCHNLEHEDDGMMLNFEIV